MSRAVVISCQQDNPGVSDNESCSSSDHSQIYPKQLDRSLTSQTQGLNCLN